MVVTQHPHKNHIDEGAINGGSKSQERSIASPHSSEYDVRAEDLCRINVCGELYITTFKMLERYPRTLLGCPADREKYWCPQLNAYFFNRNRACFESVLLYYQTGDEFPPLNVDIDLWEEEKQFYRLTFVEDYSIAVESDDDNELCSRLCNAGFNSKRAVVHAFLTNPQSSKIATVWHTIDIIFICISIAFLIMETDPNVKNEFKDPSARYYYTFYYTNVVVIVFFTIDLVARFLTWPNLIAFWKNIFNILDILSILPFYVGLFAQIFEGDDSGAEGTVAAHTSGTTELEDMGKKYVVLRVCRIFRIIRIFKFVRHSQDLILIVKVVIHAKRELFLLVILLGIFTITFGSIMYYVEHEVNNQFYSIIQGCWWSIVTITTVGYGEIVPQTPLGKFVGSVVLTLGIVFLALPMTIIVSKFSSVYEKEKSEKD